MKSNRFKLWGIPLIIAVISLYALISALVGAEVVDGIACVLLAVPIYLVFKNYYSKA